MTDRSAGLAGLRVGVDIGGTFTDIVLFEEASGSFRTLKVPSVPADPSEGAAAGIRAMLELAGRQASEVAYFCHGTTVGTNAVLEGKLSKAALITTRGFRDVLEIGRQRRPEGYNFFAVKPPAPIPRRLRFTVTERVAADGSVLTPLAEEEIGPIVEALGREGVRSVAVCLLFAFLSPGHERRIRERLRAALPAVDVYLSSDVFPEYREYERTFTVSVSAALAPVVTGYLERLERRLREAGVTGEPYLMKSSGGIMPFQMVARRPIETILSGPAAGALATAFMGKFIGRSSVIGVDMGGTSCDVSLVVDGEPLLTTEGRVGTFPLRNPIIDVKTIGAGGGSIAWLDEATALHVGPQSAGAVPGPVCYGKGGQRFTVTDANLLTGRIGVDSLFAGGIEFQTEHAARVLAETIAGPLGLSRERAALGILEIVNSNMVAAIRAVTVEKGYDPREFALMAFGGGGPLHSVALARELEIPEVIVPVGAGVFSALGTLSADIRLDVSQTQLGMLEEVDPRVIDEAFQRLERAAEAELRDSARGRQFVFLRSLGLRYQGQAYELILPLAGELRSAAKAFHERHAQLYWWSDPARAVELVTLRLSTVVPLPRPPIVERPARSGGTGPAPRARRTVLFEPEGRPDTAVYARDELAAGDRLDGPAVIESADATVLLGPEDAASVDPYGNIVIRVGR